jgi:hypothetical protein
MVSRKWREMVSLHFSVRKMNRHHFLHFLRMNLAKLEFGWYGFSLTRWGENHGGLSERQFTRSSTPVKLPGHAAGPASPV